MKFPLKADQYDCRKGDTTRATRENMITYIYRCMCAKKRVHLNFLQPPKKKLFSLVILHDYQTCKK